MPHSVHIPSQAGVGHLGPDDDDWEYEYDDHETEVIYFTLDLTTHVPDALVQKPFLSHSSGADADEDGDAEVHDSSILQMIDLHTDHPMVKLDDAVYTCTWTTDIGTQFHISEAGATDSPRRSGTVLDIVATSQTRLLGRPVELLPRNQSGKSAIANKDDTVPVISSDHDSDSETEHDAHVEQSSPTLQTAPGHKLQIPREICKDPAGEAQASFLERLSEIKLKKGEKDAVPIYSIRSYEPPPNVKELRERGLAADEEQAKLIKDAQRAATSQRPQKRRRKMSYAEKGIATREARSVDRQSQGMNRTGDGISDEMQANRPSKPNESQPLNPLGSPHAALLTPNPATTRSEDIPIDPSLANDYVSNYDDMT